MDKFRSYYKQSDILPTITLLEFNSKEFWEDVLKKLSLVVRDLSNYYSIPVSDWLNEIIIDFDINKWEKWNKTIHRLERLYGGYYVNSSNSIELNPYIYLYISKNKFLYCFYHELTHWVIEKVDYLNEYDEKKGDRWHNEDFSWVLKDIFGQYDKNVSYKDKYEKGCFKLEKKDMILELERIHLSKTCLLKKYYYNCYHRYSPKKRLIQTSSF